MQTELHPLCQAALDADHAWQALLNAKFGKSGRAARYEPRGKGEPGSSLRQAFEHYRSSQETWLKYAYNEEDQ